mmetsp:Transcript_98886/g.196093  ORF Transcript_98886/g.196093 Transcript_98886/m.196093 type:complete len:879 (+) Transcript_98886:51-2687(+)
MAADRGDVAIWNTCSFAVAGSPAASPVLVPRPCHSRNAVRRGVAFRAGVLGATLLAAAWVRDALAAPYAATFLVPGARCTATNLLIGRSRFCRCDHPTVHSHVISGTRLPRAATGLTVEELKSRLRKSKIGNVLADLVAQLEEAVLEEESEAGVNTVTINGQAASAIDHLAEGQAMLDELARLHVRAHKDDYFDYEANEWDIDGLTDDIRLAKEQLPEQQPAVSVQAEAQAIFEELVKCSGDAEKDDYFDHEANAWDIDGLKDDLRLAKEKLSEKEPETSVDAEAQALFEELVKFSGDTQKDDYFDSEANEWDVQGLKDDLRLAKAEKQSEMATVESPTTAGTEVEMAGEAPSAEALFEELKHLDSRASREDYYDAKVDAWDIDGLKDDLKLAKNTPNKPVSATVEPTPMREVTPTPQSAEALLMELQHFDPGARQEDYYDAEAGAWDIEGLQDDLNLAKSRSDEPVSATVEPMSMPEVSPAPIPSHAPLPAPAPVPERSTEQPAETMFTPLSAGQHVLAKFANDGNWYTGVLQKEKEDNTFVVKWDEPDEDVTESSVDRSFIVALGTPQPGDRVRAVWEEDGTWCDGELMKEGGDGKMIVKYDDGEVEAEVGRENVRKVVDPPRYWMAPYEDGDPALNRGAEVHAKFADDGRWYAGTVQKDNGDGSLVIKWDDPDEGESESSVQRADIRTSKLRKAQSDLTIGQKLKAIATSVVPYGVFVDIGVENDGLVHVSQMAEGRVQNPADLVEEGQTLDVWFAGVQKVTGKKQLTMVESKIRNVAAAQPRGNRDLSKFVNCDPNTWLEGEIRNVLPFGLFVSVSPPGGGEPQEGFVHVSKVRHAFIQDLEAEFKPGQEVQVRVFEANTDSNKMSLTMLREDR